jgi:CRP-like cAMP-binding protein
MSTYRNHLLLRLPAAEATGLARYLTPVDLPLRKVLIAPGVPIDHVTFIEAGLGSMVAVEDDRYQIEVGMIGREGLIGLPVVLGRDRSPNKTSMQIGGHGLRIPAEQLRRVMGASSAVREALLGYADDFIQQLAQAALANGKFKIQTRLTRWILMCHDRIDGNDIAMTHEFLGLMLGIRRASVTEALAVLQEAGLIQVRQGKVLVTDRGRLEEIARPIYSPFAGIAG